MPLVPSLVPGNCCIVRHGGSQFIAKLIERVPPNPQGAPGPTKWIARFFCVPDGQTVKDEDEMELLESQIVSRATKQDLSFASFEQGWREVHDVVDYLADYGVVIAPGTIAGYRSTWLRAQSGEGRSIPPKVRSGRRSKHAFCTTDIERWNGFVEQFGGKERVEDFQHFLRTLRRRTK